MLRKLSLLAILLLVVAVLVPTTHAQDDTFALTIMHTGETHSHHAPDGDGTGGVARVASVVKQIRAEGGNSILLDSGDRFTGTLFHVAFRGQDEVQLMNAIGYDAMTLGNHELDDGQDVLAAFLQGIDFPAVVANVDYSGSDVLNSMVNPNTVLEVGGQQIGIVGLTNRETPILVKVDSLVGLTFNTNYVEAAQAAVDELTDMGVNKIILVTHAGMTDDLAMAPELSGVDVIVGGHSADLLSNSEVGAAGPYPMELTSASDEPVLYVQSGLYNGHMGRLDVEFDANGVLTDWGGDSIFLSRYITPDAEVDAIVAGLNDQMATIRDTPVGEAAVFLTGDRSVCRAEECNLGDLITDAIRDETGSQIVITNAGGIRADIDEGEVTLGEVLTVLPFGNLVSTFSITGADLWAALENGVSRIELAEDGSIVRQDLSGRFPQVSGLRFSYDASKEAGSRVVSVEILNENDEYEPLDLDATYTAATNDFMRNGGDGYSMLAENAINPYDAGRPLDQVVADYITAHSPVGPEVEGRITLLSGE